MKTYKKTQARAVKTLNTRRAIEIEVMDPYKKNYGNLGGALRRAVLASA